MLMPAGRALAVVLLREFKQIFYINGPCACLPAARYRVLGRPLYHLSSNTRLFKFVCFYMN